jgi:hypothetical protein
MTKGGFERFHAALGDPPPGMWIERINNSEGYCPGNCRWATPKEQAANRKSKSVNPDSLRQKAIRAGIPYPRVFQRIDVGWSEERALSTPVGKRGRPKLTSTPAP